VITFPARRLTGLIDSRLVDIFAGSVPRRAVIRQVYDPLSQALVWKLPLEACQRWVTRCWFALTPGQPPKSLTAVVFKVARGLLLIAAGESDGVQPYEKFVGSRAVPGSPGALREVAD